jgi:hypothetical protein
MSTLQNNYRPWAAQGVAGPAGPPGEAGAVGATGSIGPQGPAGAVGAVGPAGPAGVAGAVGAVGPAGPAGVAGAVGAVGPAGPAGVAGAVGAVGPAGPAGVAGAVGPAGPAGVAGVAGAVGPAGIAGPAGVAGAVGPAGPAGPAGSVGFTYARGYLPSAADAVIYSDSQFQLLYVPSREALAYTVSGTHFYSSTVLKITYTQTPHIITSGTTSKSRSILRGVRPATTENLYGGSNWETDYFEAEDSIDLRISGGNSFDGPIFEFSLVRSGGFVRWHLTRHNYA